MKITMNDMEMGGGEHEQRETLVGHVLLGLIFFFHGFAATLGISWRLFASQLRGTSFKNRYGPKTGP